jgi:hypothetical protein
MFSMAFRGLIGRTDGSVIISLPEQDEMAFYQQAYDDIKITHFYANEKLLKQ